MQRARHRLLASAGVLLAIGALTVTSASVASSASGAPARSAQPGAPSVGDYLFPGLGNGGYDAKHYALKLHYPTTAPSQQVQGRVRMDAVATQGLSQFNLDFGGDTVGSVAVNGQPAKYIWQQDKGELVITPARAVSSGGTLTVDVAFTSHPITPEPGNLYPVGWVATPHGSFTSFQADTAHDTYPVNDHPSDKASYTFELDVPTGVVAATNGKLAAKTSGNGRTVWTYQERHPLASELVQLAVGTDLTIVDRGTTGEVALRDVITNVHSDIVEPAFARGPANLRWVVDKVGAFPADAYGNLAVDQPFGYSLETQSLALHSYVLFDPTFRPGRTGEPWFYDSILIHEIAHEYFGNSVSPFRWSDIWLNEGWATYMMKLWESDQGTIDEWGYASLEEYMKDQYSRGDIVRAEHGPVARPRSGDDLFNENVYDGGALVLFALKQQVGDVNFRQIMRGWPQQNRDSVRSTDDFIAFASRTSGKDLRPFLRAWVYGDTTPPMPGHPDWTVTPPNAKAAAALGVHAHQHGWALAG